MKHLILTKYKYLRIIFLLLITSIIPSWIVSKENEPYRYKVEILSSFGDGKNNPYFFTANKQGLASSSLNNGYLRTELNKGFTLSSKNKLSLFADIDLVIPYNYSSNFILQQAFIDLNWHFVQLSIGSKERFSELKHPTLSSGGFTFSSNSRPIPQARIEIPHYVSFPGANDWLQVRGHIAYGSWSDGNFQTNFAKSNPQTRYGKNILYHSKAAFIKIGKLSTFPLLFEGGIEHYNQFGGDFYTHDKGHILSMPHSLIDYWKAFIPLSGGKDTPDVEQTNISGNQLGSWHIGLETEICGWKIRAYGEHFFEDFSQLFFFEYQMNQHGKRRVIYYPWKDGLLGLEIKPASLSFIDTFVYEFIHTKDQSGALYHDPSDYFFEQMDGADNYYNHGIYPGWHHWGVGIGNPLIISPIYNDNNQLQFRSNRLIAHHFGINGKISPIDELSYRLLYTYSEHWGTYSNPFTKKKYSTSIICELTYSPTSFRNWHGKFAYALDRSTLIGNNQGFMFSIIHTGLFK